MSTTGNDSSGRHREDAAGAPASTLTQPVTDAGSSRTQAVADRTADKASGAAHAAADKASGAAHAAADKFAAMRSSITSKSAKDTAPVKVTTDEPSVGDLVKDASTHMSTLVRNEIELAKTELTSTVKKAAIGGALFVVAAVILLYSLTFGLIAAAEGLHAGGFPRWASYLIVWGALVLIAAIAALVGILLVKRMKKPERTLSTVKETAAWAKSRGKSD